MVGNIGWVLPSEPEAWALSMKPKTSALHRAWP